MSRPHRAASHGAEGWARGMGGDGLRGVRVNTIEGLWQTVRDFPRGFRGVRKKGLK